MAVGPVAKGHDVAPAIQDLARRESLQDFRDAPQELAEVVASLGKDVHMRSDYGDEDAGLPPWDLFDEKSAGALLRAARRAVELAKRVVEGG